MCEDCKALNPDGMRFCDQCSAPLPPSSQVSLPRLPGSFDQTVHAMPASQYQRPQAYPDQGYPFERPNYNELPSQSPNSFSRSAASIQPSGSIQVTPTPTPLPYEPPSLPAQISGTGPENFNQVNFPVLPATVPPAVQPPGKIVNNNTVSNNPSLIVTRGARLGEKFTLNPGINEIGRWDEDENYFPHIDLDKQDSEGFVHRRHAFIRYKNGNWWIEDAGGANGTKVRRGGQTNRLAPRGSRPLQPGDEVIIGRVFLLFESF